MGTITQIAEYDIYISKLKSLLAKVTGKVACGVTGKKFSLIWSRARKVLKLYKKIILVSNVSALKIFLDQTQANKISITQARLD